MSEPAPAHPDRTRIYDQELRKAGLEVTQFGLLTALAATGEANQKRLSAGFAMDSTTLTRTLGLLRKQGWVQVKRGKDRRERLFSLTRAGQRQMAEAQPYWESAEHRLRQELGDTGLEEDERDRIPIDGSRDISMNFCSPIRCIYI